MVLKVIKIYYFEQLRYSVIYRGWWGR